MGPSIFDELATAGQYSLAELKAWGQQVAAEYQVPWPIFDAMITVESGWSTSPAEISSTGAQGIAQIEPGTASDWGVNPWDPIAALAAAAKHLSEYYSENGNSWFNALAAYNGGDSPQGIANGIAAGYPQKVLGIAGLGGSTAPPASSGGSAIAASSPSSSSGTQTGIKPASFSPAVLEGIAAAAIIAAIVAIAI